MTRNRKRPGDAAFVQAVAAVLFIAACAYIGAGLLRDLRPGRETAIVRRASVTDSVELKGIAVRREQLICSPDGAAHLADGKRVKAGTALSRAVFAPVSAIFFSDFDGLESLSAEDLEELSVASLTALLEAGPQTPADAVGRIVTGCDWYYAALAPAGTELTKKEYSLCFAGLDARVRARLLYQSEAEEGEMALLFRLTQGGAEYLRLRKTGAMLILSEYTGLELPEQAVQTDPDGSTFVYTLTAGDERKTAVEILYTARGRCIVAVSREPSGLREGSTVALT